MLPCRCPHQFIISQYGTGVGNWVGGSDMLAFSRGDRGFFAMGNVDGDFDTGLADGDYCDLISECQQTVTVSGGRAHIKPHSGEEPVVAICVGCGKSPTTTHRPDTTTQSTTESSTVSTTVVSTAPGYCCHTLHLSSQAGVAQYYPELLGSYSRLGEEKDRPVYRHQTILTTMHLHYTTDPHYKWEGWMVTADNNQTFGFIANTGDNFCPLGLNSGWEYQLPTGWQEDPTMTVTCGDHDGPTEGSTTSSQPGPGPGGVQPTVVAIKRQTVPGSDVFIVGGVAPGQEIDITLHPFPANWESYNAWRRGDDHLDWDGAEPGQGEFAPDENDPTEYPVRAV